MLDFGQKVADCRTHGSMEMVWREKMRLEGCSVRGVWAVRTWGGLCEPGSESVLGVGYLT